MIDLVHPADGSIVDVRGLEIGTGRRVVLFGPNGVGKTTCLRLLAGLLDRPAAGPFTYLPQVPYLFRGTVGWNLGLGLRPERAAWAAQLAERMGVGGLLGEPSWVLSGGERARIALARSLASPEPLVLLDEPLAAIDAVDRPSLVRVILEAIGDRAAVIVTHDLAEVVGLASHVAVLDAGRMVQFGPAAEVLAHPASDSVARVIGVSNLIEGRAVETEVSMVRARSGEVTMTGLGEAEPGDRVRIMFPAEAVTLYRAGTSGSGSARNVWSGVVTAVEPVGRLVEVTVDVGLDIVALITSGSQEELEIVVGTEVEAAVKAASVTVVPVG